MNKRKLVQLLVFILTLTMCLTVVNASSPNKEAAIKTLKLHVIDVGQADTLLLQLPNNKTVLIDGGNREDAGKIISYLEKLKIVNINWLIVTHAHEDHIGALPEVLKKFKVEAVIMPNATANTKIFEDLLLAIKNKGLKITAAAAGMKVIDEKELKLTIIAPNSKSYEGQNDYSVVTKIEYKSNSFLLTGDIESISEAEILKKGYNIKADLIKIAHHGSSSSSTTNFLKTVNPKYAIISVGKDNTYNHPAKTTLDRLAAQKVTVYRTDLNGDIVAESDGTDIKVSTSLTTIKPNAPPAKTTTTYVYITKSGKKYHIDGCSYLAKSKIKILLTDAKKKFDPCSKCNPPK